MSAYNQRLESSSRRIFVDKTPRYFHIVGFLENLFPAAKKIWLKRNPLDVVASYQTSWKITADQLFDPEFGPMALDLPLGLHELSTLFCGQPNTFEIRYEDIVETPAAVSEQLCGFLGLTYQRGMEIYGTNTTKLAERKSKSMGDDKLFSDVQPHNRSVGQWRRVLNREQIQKALSCLGSRIFERMGYGEMIPELLADGFYFPDDQTIEGHLSAFRNASKWLPWAYKNKTAV
jgi:hypothetical protein